MPRLFHMRPARTAPSKKSQYVEDMCPPPPHKPSAPLDVSPKADRAGNVAVAYRVALSV